MSLGTWLSSGGAALFGAAVGAIVGGIGIRNANRAHSLAEKANQRAEHAEKRATERRNIRWEITETAGSMGHGARGLYSVLVANRGLDTAYDVTLTLEAPFAHLARESFDVLASDEVGEVETEWRKPAWLQKSPGITAPAHGPPRTCTVRIAWRSEHGVWDEHVIVWPG